MELANLIEALRPAVGPGGILEINPQYHDIWPLMLAGDTDVSRALRYATQVDKEFKDQDLDAQVVATMIGGRWVFQPPPWG